MTVAFEGTDAQYGWAWSFWRSTLKPVVRDISEFSPLYPALLAANSNLPVRIVGDYHGIDFLVREADGYVYVLAARKNPGPVSVTFRVLPAGVSQGEVLYEGGRKVSVSPNGTFVDSFETWDVHVYRFH